MEELGYDLNSVKKQSKTDIKIIVVLTSSTATPYYSKVMEGIKTSAAHRGFHLLISQETITEASFKSFLDILRVSKASGVITLSKEMSTELLAELNANLPVIQCCEYNKESNVPYIGIDDYSAAKSATDFILYSGRQKIAFVSGPLNFRYAQERLLGFKDSLAEHGLAITSQWMLTLPNVSYDLAYSSIYQLLGNSPVPNALFATSDVFAISAINAARHLNIRVPQDLSVVGFDNIDMATIVTPTITSVKKPSFQIGFSSCESLIERIINPSHVSTSILLDTELVVRESSISLTV
jgi:LacI family repressor for deo operon, udp, cdd, tsx, nupC, and nupG